MKVLIVDDDELDRQLIKRTLEQGKICTEITEASSVDEGMRLCGSEHFDIVLLDYLMPQRNGFEMVLEIRSQQIQGDTAIIMMSSVENEEVAIDCLKAGAQDFLVKSEVTESHLRRAMVHSSVRYELEHKLQDSYKQVKTLAEHDGLTGLANRFHFDKSLKAILSNNQRRNAKTALIIFDLDNFKDINDNHGHHMGDLLLKRVVYRVNSCLRQNEEFSRLGGDEFAIILDGIRDAREASAVAQRIINILRKAFLIENRTLQTSASIGISIAPDNANESEILFKYSDIAMYRAKHQKKNQLCFFEEKMQQQFLLRLETENALKLAIKKQQFILHFQPVINPKDNTLLGFEALIRWQDGNKLRMPDEFITIAEETDLICEIGEWVITEAISTLALWNKNQPTPLRMAINISAVQLKDNNLIDYLTQCLAQFNVSPNLIDIEVTETALFKNKKTASHVLDKLNELGCKVLLDDFGTGYSSISHLSNFQISGIKIDKSLMPKDSADCKHSTLIRCLTLMANTLNLSIVAEGIDNSYKMALCNELHIDSIQGYLVSKPKPKDMIEHEYKVT